MVVSILGCGWYGRSLGIDLLEKGFRVKGSTTTTAKLAGISELGILPYLIDVSKPELLKDNSDFFDCDWLIISSNTGIDRNTGYLDDINGLITTIEKHSIRQVIFISSISVYGEPNQLVDEYTIPSPVTNVAKLLLQAENQFLTNDNFVTTIIRFGGLVGPGRMPGKFLAGRSGITNGLAPVNLIHLEDCIGITELIISSGPSNGIINAVAPHHPTRSDFYTMAATNDELERPEFISEKNKWKLVSGDALNKLGYVFKINNWFEWLHK